MQRRYLQGSSRGVSLNIRRRDAAVVREEELKDYLADGWQFVSVLPSHGILVKKTD